jgi:hypothetical protein
VYDTPAIADVNFTIEEWAIEVRNQISSFLFIDAVLIVVKANDAMIDL